VRDNGLSFAAALASPDASQAKTDKSGRTSIAITVMDVKVLVFISLSGFHRGLAKSLLGWLRSQRDQHGLLYSTLND
jgi:hypothetical protein